MFKNSRWLLQSLILSGVLNIALVLIFFYFIICDDPLHFSYAPSKEKCAGQPPCPKSFLLTLRSLPYSHLIDLLADERSVESGYRVRDFALGVLASNYHLDVGRALGKKILEEKTWIFEGSTFLLFPGLRKDDFRSIQEFMEQEIWPLTPKGLFLEIAKKPLTECEKELIVQFCHTPEFVLFETFFARAGACVQRGVLMTMIFEGGYERFSEFYRQQEKAIDFSEERRRSLLLSYVEGGSKAAAYLLVKTDPAFVENVLEDKKVALLLDLLPSKSPEALQFAKKIATSPRSELLVKKARAKLSPEEADELAGRFINRPSIGHLRPKFREPIPASPDPRTHVVQSGESLWTLSKKYNISIETLMQLNSLQSTVIQPGKVLKIR